MRFIISKLSIQGQIQNEIICDHFCTSKAGNIRLPEEVQEGSVKLFLYIHTFLCHLMV